MIERRWSPFPFLALIQPDASLHCHTTNPKASVQLPVAKKRFSRVDYSSINATLTLLSKAATTVGYGNSAHLDDGCKHQRCVENCGQTTGDMDKKCSYYWQPIETGHRPIQRYYCGPTTTHRLVTVAYITLQTDRHKLVL